MNLLGSVTLIYIIHFYTKDYVGEYDFTGSYLPHFIAFLFYLGLDALFRLMYELILPIANKIKDKLIKS